MRKISDNDLKNVQLIILDMDGTLLNKYGKVSDNIVKSIKTLIEIGVKITLASARVFPSMKKYADLLEIDTPLICLDGALIKDRHSKTILNLAALRNGVVKKAIKLAESNLIQIGLSHQDEIFHTEDSESLPMVLEKSGAVYTIVRDLNKYVDNTLEILCTGDNKKALESMARKLKFPFSFGNSVNVFRSRMFPEIHYLECKKAGSSKGKGMKILLKYLKIKEENTLVAGDWYNDIPMFNTNAIKVALKNSIPRLKLKADIFLKKTNDEDGLLEILDKIIFLKS